MDNSLVTKFGYIFVMLAGLLRFLLEAVQHINSFRKFGDIHYSKSAVWKLDADFFRSSTKLIKRFPVIWFISALNFAQLCASYPASL